MFLRTTESRYTRDGQQRAAGPFLLVFTNTNTFTCETELRCCVRTAILKQCGHWMMGHVILRGGTLAISGAYGADGLTLDAGKLATAHDVKTLWDTLVPVPDELRLAFWQGGGHNSAGNEGPAMRAWAVENEKQLRRAGR